MDIEIRRKNIKKYFKRQILDSGNLLIENEDYQRELDVPSSVLLAYINICSDMKNIEQHCQLLMKNFLMFL